MIAAQAPAMPSCGATHPRLIRASVYCSIVLRQPPRRSAAVVRTLIHPARARRALRWMSRASCSEVRWDGPSCSVHTRHRPPWRSGFPSVPSAPIWPLATGSGSPARTAARRSIVSGGESALIRARCSASRSGARRGMRCRSRASRSRSTVDHARSRPSDPGRGCRIKWSAATTSASRPRRMMSCRRSRFMSRWQCCASCSVKTESAMALGSGAGLRQAPSGRGDRGVGVWAARGKARRFRLWARGGFRRLRPG